MKTRRREFSGIIELENAGAAKMSRVVGISANTADAPGPVTWLCKMNHSTSKYAQKRLLQGEGSLEKGSRLTNQAV
jgi:hypothetical protein